MIMMSLDDLKSLEIEETLETLSNAETEMLADIQEADEEREAGRAVRLTREEALKRLARH